MAHVIPRHREQDGWPIDYEAINEDFRATVEEMEGKLGEHNWRSGAITARTDLAPDAVLDVNFTATSVDPDLETGNGRPTNGPANAFLIRNITTWQSVDNMSATKDTGNSLLWIIASFQHQTYGTIVESSIGAAYALRLDGQVVAESLIGGVDRENDPLGECVFAQAYAYVTDALIPVPPGRHTVELVARAVRDQNYAVPDESAGAVRHSEVFNREIILVTIDPPSADLSGAGVSFTPLLEGDTINAASLNTPFSSVASEVNDLDPPSIQKESLHAVHLPSMISRSGYTSIGVGGAFSYSSVINPYPGYDSELGWGIVQDGAGNLLQVTFVSLDLSDADNRGVLVLANVHVIQLQGTAGGLSVTDIESCYAAFAIQVRDGTGAWFTVAKTERYTNAEVEDPTAGPPGVQVVERKNVPIRTFVTQAVINAAGGNNLIQGVRVVVSLAERSVAATDVTVTIEEGDLTILGLQAGS